MNNYYENINAKNEERFIGPLLPFVGGALIGYIVARPNNNVNAYYPVPYYTYYNQYPVYNMNQYPIYR